MLNESKPKDVRFLAMILCLWAEIITLGKAEEIMVELGIIDTDKLIKTYEELSKYLLLQNISFRKLKNKGGFL